MQKNNFVSRNVLLTQNPTNQGSPLSIVPDHMTGY